MYTADGVSAAPFQTRPESPIHLLLHLSISPLHGVQVPVAGVVALDLPGRNKFHHHVMSLFLGIASCGIRTSTDEAAPPPTPILYTGPPIFTTCIPDDERRAQSRCESSVGACVNIASAFRTEPGIATSLCFFFLYVSVLDRTETAAEHDWLNPLPPLSVRQPHAERTGETCARGERPNKFLPICLKS